jgi:hypothetical protein
MPTPYTGNPLASEAPGGAPEPEGAPLIVLPADADPPNASTFIQAYKALADWVAFSLKPRAKTGNWTDAITKWRDAAGRKRFGIDHLGFPGGQLNRWRQGWDASFTQAGAGTTALADGWFSEVVKAGAGTGQAGSIAPNVNFAGSRFARLEGADSANDCSYVSKSAPCWFNSNFLIAMWWDGRIPTLQNYIHVMGFNDIISFKSPVLHGPQARFYNSGGSGNWHCQTDDGAAKTDVDSGVAVDTSVHRFRIEFHGSVLDESGTERVLFFIDGNVVANITTHLPSAGGGQEAIPLMGIFNSAPGTGGRLEVGVVQGCNTLWTDAFI